MSPWRSAHFFTHEGYGGFVLPLWDSLGSGSGIALSTFQGHSPGLVRGDLPAWKIGGISFLVYPHLTTPLLLETGNVVVHPRNIIDE